MPRICKQEAQVMKKIISSVLSAAMILSLCPVANFRTSAFTFPPNWEFDKDGSNATITKYTGPAASEVEIPAKLGDYTVTGIKTPGYAGLFGSTAVKSVFIPEGITSVNDLAFYNCTALERIRVDENNPNYTDDDGVLYNKNKTTLIRYPQAKADASFTVPDSVTDIRYHAFNASRLDSVSLPDGYARQGNIFGSVIVYRSDGSTYDFRFDYESNDGNGTAMITKYMGRAASLTIPETINDYTVTGIGDGAFLYCKGLERGVSIPKTVTSIGDKAFSQSNLTSIEIPSSVTSIGVSAFEGSSLTSVAIPDSVTSVSKDAFAFCRQLTSVVIPQSVTSIGSGAFRASSKLTSVEIPSSVTSIDSNAFSECSKLADIKLPETVTSIGEDAFFLCGSLTGIIIPKAVTSISRGVFGTTGLRSVVIPDGVTSIDTLAFGHCTALESVIIPDSVASIHRLAFSGCEKLKKVYIYTNSTENPYGDIFKNAELILIKPDSISITAEPAKKIYKVGEKLDTEGMVVKLTYADGQSKEITDYTLGDFDSSSVGAKTVTVSYGDDKMAYLEVSVVRSLESISVEQPEIVTYIAGQRQKLDTDGMVVRANYDDGSSEVVPKENYTLSGFNLARAGVQTVTVSYEGKTGSFGIIVLNNLTQIKVSMDFSVIVNGAFRTDITDVTIGDNVKEIDINAFTATENIIIRGYKGSAAEDFSKKAKAKGITVIFAYMVVVPGCVTGAQSEKSLPTMSDALALFKGIVCDKTDSFFCKAAADVNGDGNINLVDCLDLLIKLKNLPAAPVSAQTAKTEQKATA